MADHKSSKEHKDPHVIDINDPMDVEYVHHQYPWISHDKIREVIRRHGPDRDAVNAELEKIGGKDESRNN